MSSTFKDLGIDRLSHEERLQLISEIWESLMPIDHLKISRGHCEELDRRIAAADADQLPGTPWEEVRGRLRS